MEAPHVILDLVGGSEDGVRYEGAIANPYFWQADHGRVGARFQLIPDARFRDQLFNRNQTDFDPAHYEIYEIEKRREEWDHIFVRARYIGRKDSTPVE
jgi:hypothetical protein